MAINFPDSPSNGDTHTVGDITWTYNTSKTRWTSSSAGSSGGSSVTVSDTAPTSPSDGDQWFNSTSLKMFVYYADGSSSQWVPASPQQTGPSGQAGTSATPTSYANLAAFPSSGNTAGDFGFATDTKAVYVWDGTEWDRIYTDTNAVPEWTTEPPATADLAPDGTATTQTVVASDPEGFPIEYSYDTNPSNQAQATISQSNNVFTITPSTVSANSGDFTLRYKATDGLHTTAKSTLYTLGFFPQADNLWGHWDMGQSASYSGTGTLWSDLSGNNRDLTWTNVPGSAGYKASGNLSVPVWETGADASRFALTLNSTVKTIMFIFDPLVDPVPSNFQQIFLGTSNNGIYGGYFDNYGSSMMAGIGAQSGLTADYLVNGNSNPIASAGQAALEYNKFNSFFMRNWDLGTYNFFKYSSGTFNNSIQLRAIAMWTVALSDAEIQNAHSSYTQMATWDG